jgi:hypothetical protein
MISFGIKAAPYFCDGYIIQPEILRADKGHLRRIKIE